MNLPKRLIENIGMDCYLLDNLLDVDSMHRSVIRKTAYTRMDTCEASPSDHRRAWIRKKFYNTEIAYNERAAFEQILSTKGANLGCFEFPAFSSFGHYYFKTPFHQLKQEEEEEDPEYPDDSLFFATRNSDLFFPYSRHHDVREWLIQTPFLNHLTDVDVVSLLFQMAVQLQEFHRCGL